MNNKIIILFISFSFAFLSCNDNTSNPIKLECDQEIIVDNTSFENSPNDSFEFKNVEIINNCLSITIEYGGGCGTVEVNLIDSEFIEESNPLQRRIRLSFKDEDSCKALISKKVSFSLEPIQIAGENIIILNLTNWEKQILYQY